MVVASGADILPLATACSAMEPILMPQAPVNISGQAEVET
jgi:hypothetical protein